MPSCYDAEYKIDHMLRLATVSIRLRGAAYHRPATEPSDEAFPVSASLAGRCPGPRRGITARRSLTPAKREGAVFDPLSKLSHRCVLPRGGPIVAEIPILVEDAGIQGTPTASGVLR